MTDEPELPLGQRANAARTHRQLVWFFVVCAIIYPSAWTEIGSNVKVILCMAMAAANYMIASAAQRREPWAQTGSLALAVLMLALGAVFFFKRPDILSYTDQGDLVAATIGSFVVVLAVIQIIAAIYLLLNANWQRPTPPDEKPDSNMKP